MRKSHARCRRRCSIKHGLTTSPCYDTINSELIESRIRMIKNLPIIIGATALVASTAAFFMLQQQVKPLQSDLSQAKQTLTSAQKVSDNKKTAASKPKADKNEATNTVLKISADAAYTSYQKAAQKYLDAYITESKKIKGPLQNIDQNEALAPLSAVFGVNGVPDVDTSGDEPPHLMFEPYAYRNPVMEFSALTPSGDGTFNGRLTVKSDGIKPIEINFSYDSKLNSITKLGAYTEKSEQQAPDGNDVNNNTTDVPTNPLFPNPDES